MLLDWCQGRWTQDSDDQINGTSACGVTGPHSRRMEGLMEGWMETWSVGWFDECVDGFIDVRMDKEMEGWMDG